MDFKEISFTIENRVAVLTLNRPDIRNAITGFDMLNELGRACAMVNEDRSVCVMIITGADPAFSSGGNVKDMLDKKGMFAGNPTEIMVSYRKHVQRIPALLSAVEVPLIAAVNGPAVGAGFDMSLMCDIRVASEKARFGETFLNVGLIPGDGGAWFLPRAVGLSKACELTFTGDVITAEEALGMGLVSSVVPHENLMETAMGIAAKIAKKPPEALRMAKRLIHMGQRLTLPDLLEQSAALQALCHHSADHAEALSAMFEKREAVYSGK
ncbi:crotonase/enoyl-CoA hydratase family protein [Desulfatiferula olefinivorans]